MTPPQAHDRAPHRGDMDIYLVPLGPHRGELYCESDDRQPPAGAGGRPGWRRLVRRFRDGLTALEAERRTRLSRASAAESRTRAQRLRDRAMGWLSERIAEQRLLWLLRSETVVTAYYPDDFTAGDADRGVRGGLRRDRRRHLVWMIVDALVYVASLPLTPIPGPNVLALYFSFRAIGHLLSWRGARQGLSRVRWQFVASAPLTDLRRLETLTGAGREALARDVAMRLELRHLDTFVERIALAGP
jgi:hypothetical protein